MIRGTAECLIGPQPNDASVSHLEVCAEEIAASIFWYAHACHRGLSPASAILCLTLAEKQSCRQFAIRAHPPQGRTPRRRLDACYCTLHTFEAHAVHASLSFRALIRQLLMWRGHWSVAHPEVAYFDSHLSAPGRPGMDLYKVFMVLLLL